MPVTVTAAMIGHARAKLRLGDKTIKPQLCQNAFQGYARTPRSGDLVERPGLFPIGADALAAEQGSRDFPIPGGPGSLIAMPLV